HENRGEEFMAEPKIWMNGKLVPNAEAVLPVNSAAVFYATNVFEGLRAYWNEGDQQLYAFRLDAHFARLRESMKMMRFAVPYSDADLHAAVREVLSGNGLREDIHMHLVGYVAGAGLEATSPTGLYINPRRRPRIGDGNGLKACVTSWQRTNDNAIPIRLKCGANYQNGRLAGLQAKAGGYDSPIFLNRHGTVAEGTGATFFMVRRGKLVTPPVTSDILESITRATLIESLCPALGMEVVERDIARTELYVADEAFFCGSGYEITPIVSIDRFPLGDGKIGPVTQRLYNAYMVVVRGGDKRFPEWRTPVHRPVRGQRRGGRTRSPAGRPPRGESRGPPAGTSSGHCRGRPPACARCRAARRPGSTSPPARCRARTATRPSRETPPPSAMVPPAPWFPWADHTFTRGRTGAARTGVECGGAAATSRAGGSREQGLEDGQARVLRGAASQHLLPDLLQHRASRPGPDGAAVRLRALVGGGSDCDGPP